MTFNNTTPANFLDVSANGRASSSPFVDIFKPRDPTTSDITSETSINNYAIQQKWLNTTTNALWELKNYTTSQGVLSANWILIAQHNVVTESLRDQNGVNDVYPDATNEINVVGDGTYIITTGNPATNTLTISPTGAITQLYTENMGTATPMAGNLNVFGANGITTTGSGNTITITGPNVPPQNIAFNYTNVTHAMSPYTVNVTTPPVDYYISVDCSLGAVTLEFPNAPTFKQLWIVKDRTGNASTNHISLTTPGGTVTIDGLTTYVMAGNYDAINILANATPTYEVY